MSGTTPTSPAPAAGDDAAGTADAAGALPGSPAGQPPGPLSGPLPADFSRILAGPYCTMLLADPRRGGRQGGEPGPRQPASGLDL
jgi:hypothetical protein